MNTKRIRVQAKLSRFITRNLTLFNPTFERSDIKAMSFYPWLKAKMQSRPYYDVLLELEGAFYAVTDAPANDVIIQVF